MGAEEKIKAMLGVVADFSCPVLVCGGNSKSRMECAEALCCLLEGKESPLNSRDVLFIPRSPSPSISQVRETVDLMQKSPVSLPRRIGVIEDLSSLSEASQDALLKDLEEPAKKSSPLLFHLPLFRRGGGDRGRRSEEPPFRPPFLFEDV